MKSLLSVQELAEIIDAPDVRVLDATLFLPGSGRDAAAEYAEAHLPGAQFLDLDTLADPGDASPHMLPAAALFAERVGALGVNAGDRIVLYDNSPLRTAARGWWMFRLFGARQVALLDGGLAAWFAAGLPTESGPAAVPTPARFAAAADLSGVRTKADMLAIAADDSAQIVDARGAGRFTGEEAEPRPGVEGGHIPGSRHLHYAELFDADGHWRADAELRAAFERARIALDRPIVATCGSGVTAADIVFAAERLGARQVALYDGSWSEWGADPATPKAKGPA